MAPNKMLASGLLLALVACRHTKSRVDADEVNPRLEIRSDMADARVPLKAGAEDVGAADDKVNPRVPIDLDLPVSIAQLWKSGSKSLTLHQTLAMGACEGEDGDSNSGVTDLSYHYDRHSKKLQLSTTKCGSVKNSELLLTSAQGKAIDQLVESLKLVNGSNMACADDAPILELILESSESVEQSFPVAVSSCGGIEQKRLEFGTFQQLFAALTKILP